MQKGQQPGQQLELVQKLGRAAAYHQAASRRVMVLAQLVHQLSRHRSLRPVLQRGYLDLVRAATMEVPR